MSVNAMNLNPMNPAPDPVPAPLIPAIPLLVGKAPGPETEAAWAEAEGLLRQGVPPHTALPEVREEGGKVVAEGGPAAARRTVLVLRGWLHGFRPRASTPEEAARGEALLARLEGLARALGACREWRALPEVARRVRFGEGHPLAAAAVGRALARRPGAGVRAATPADVLGWCLEAGRALLEEEQRLGQAVQVLRLLEADEAGFDPDRQRGAILARVRRGQHTRVRARGEGLVELARAVAAELTARRSLLPGRYLFSARPEAPHPGVGADVAACWEWVKGRASEDPEGDTLRLRWAHHNLLDEREHQALQALGLEVDPTDPASLAGVAEAAMGRLEELEPLVNPLELPLGAQAALGLVEEGGGWSLDKDQLSRTFERLRRRAYERRSRVSEQPARRAVIAALALYPRLPQAEVQGLMALARQGQAEAVERLALEAMPALLRQGLEYLGVLGEEVVSLAWEVAVEGVRTQKSAHHHPAAWASVLMRRRLGYLAEQRRQGVKLSEGAIKALHKVRRAVEAGHTDPEAIARASGVEAERVTLLLPLVRPALELDAPLGEEDAPSLGERLAGGEDPARSCEDAWLRAAVDRALEQLDAPQRALVEAVAMGGRPLEEAAGEEGLRAEEAAALLEAALARLREDPYLQDLWREGRAA